MKSRSIRNLTIIVLVVGGMMGAMLTSCGSHKKAGVTAKPVGNKGYSTTSVEKSMGKNEFKGLPDASQRLVKEADSWLGTPYAYGVAEKKRGVDCSGLTTSVFRDALNIKLPRSSAQQQQWCAPLPVDSLMIGDLVFFSPSGKKGSVSHVGIYIGNGNMIHSSTSKGVVVTSLSDAYFKRTYHSAGRVEKYYAMIDSPVKRQPEPKTPASTETTTAQAPQKTENITVTNEVSVEQLDKVLASKRPETESNKSTKKDYATGTAQKAKADSIGGKGKTITTVKVGATATKTTESPEEARRRALEKLKTED